MDSDSRSNVRTVAVVLIFFVACFIVSFLSDTVFWTTGSRLEPFGTSVKIGTLRRRLAWPLVKDDTHKWRNRSVEEEPQDGGIKPDPVCWQGPPKFQVGINPYQVPSRNQPNPLEPLASTSPIPSPSFSSSDPSFQLPSGSDPHNAVGVQGMGCLVCFTGSTCTFRLSLDSRLSLWLDQDVPRRREVMVIIEGPVLLEGVATPISTMPTNNQLEWMVSYLPFDPGEYVVTIYAECSITFPGYPLSVPAASAPSEATTYLAQFSLTVYANRTTQAQQQQQQQQEQQQQEQEQEQEQEQDQEQQQQQQQQELQQEQRRPCDAGVYGRWIPTAASPGSSSGPGPYTWQFFDCAIAQDRDSFLLALWRRNISEINFVGDSHNRMLYHHLCYLLNGWVNVAEKMWHGDLVNEASLIGGGKIILRYYWVDGIFQNGRFGCARRGIWSGRAQDWPKLPPPVSGALYVLNSGHWTFMECSEPERAYAYYLPGFLAWAKSLLKAESPSSRVVWRSTTAMNVRFYGCTLTEERGHPPKGRSNAGLRFANEVARVLALRAGFQYFDSWQVEAPFYFDNSAFDYHFSGVTDDGHVRGIVGEAITRHFMTWAATFMR